MGRLLRAASGLPPGLRRTIKRIPGFDRARAWILERPRLPGPAPGEKRPVVYPPTWIEWDAMRQRPQYLLQAFARAGHPTYLVDLSVDRVREVEPGLWVVPGLRHVPGSKVIIYCHFAPLRHLFDRFEDPVVIYDLLDDLSIYDDQERGLPEERRVRFHHPKVMERADLVIVSNRVLAERHRGERPDLVLVENGVDPVPFERPTSRPPDLPDRFPIIGYHGMISTWFDFDLLDRVAAARPDWCFALVGPVDSRVGWTPETDNVVLLGERRPEEIPAYVQAFDVGAIWFRVTPMTEGVTPLKMYEYLAAGVPCVATPLPACVDEPLVTTAADPAGFIEAVEEALATAADPAQRRARREAARARSWDVRLRPALDRLAELGLDSLPA